MEIDNRNHVVSAAALLLLAIFACLQAPALTADPPPRTELLVGFKATPDPSITSFQPLLFDSSSNYSLGFFRVNANQLRLSVLHVPSSVQLWSANPTRSARWAGSVQVLFNGSLVLSDPRSGIFWSTQSSGDRVWLSNTSNLIVHKADAGDSLLWQSFDFPSDTLVENQNFTMAMALTSANGLYSLRLGVDYWGLYADFGNLDRPGQLYFKHSALETKANVIPGRPVQLVLETGGFLGMYQNGSVPADVQPFNSFQQDISGIIRRVRIEPDGDLKGYYWTGTSWELDYQAISDPCQLPSTCGAYGLCRSDGECSCVSDRTFHGSSGGCEPSSNIQNSGDLCAAGENQFGVVRRSGVELPFKELMAYVKMASVLACERACEGNCTCWGVVYSNSSGLCYTLGYPVQTLVAVGDETKVGYFKIREGASSGRRGVDTWLRLLISGAVLVILGVLGLSWYKVRSRGAKGYVAESVGGIRQYKDLGAASFRSIELPER